MEHKGGMSFMENMHAAYGNDIGGKEDKGTKVSLLESK
jgi:hypothetical protein